MEEQEKQAPQPDVEALVKEAEERGRKAGYEQAMRESLDKPAMWEQPRVAEQELDVNGDGCEILKCIRPCVWD